MCSGANCERSGKGRVHVLGDKNGTVEPRTTVNHAMSHRVDFTAEAMLRVSPLHGVASRSISTVLRDEICSFSFLLPLSSS